MVGSDKEKRMIESSHANLNWVQKLYNLSNDNYPKLFVHDATQPFPEHLRGQIDAIITEPFLGTPLLKTLPRVEAEDFLKKQPTSPSSQVPISLNVFLKDWEYIFPET